MSGPQAITEESGVHKQWYDQAREQTLETLPEFLRHLTQDYRHDYGTICHAIAAAMDAAGRAVDRSSCGGVTGFQASCIAWEVIKRWMAMGDGPARIQTMSDLLYPQLEHRFLAISADTWRWVQDQARVKLAQRAGHMDPSVRAHMERVVAGEVPFGLRIEA